MWNRIKQFLAAPTFEFDTEKTFSARILNTILLIVIISAVIFPVINALSGQDVGPIVTTLLWIIFVSLVTLKILLERGSVRLVGILLSLVWWAVFTFAAFSFGGLHDTAIVGFYFLIILASIVTERRALFVIVGLTAASFVVLYIAEQTGFLVPTLNIPTLPDDLTLLLLLLISSVVVLRASVNQLTRAYAETNAITRTLARNNMQLDTNRSILTDQARQLEQRNRYLGVSTAITQETNKNLNLRPLLSRLTTLISEAFDFDHTGIYLLDSTGQTATIVAASSTGGRQMVANGHRVSIDSPRLVGDVLKKGLQRIARDASFENPELPNTRSAAALPLFIGDEIVGVLDVQSNTPDAFDRETTNILQSLADQVATAVQAANLSAQLEESITASRKAFSALSQEAWQEIFQARTRYGYQYFQGRIYPIEEQTESVFDVPSEISIPLKMGGMTIGTIKAQKQDIDTAWSHAETSMLETLAEQLSVALESARLYQDTQNRAAQEQIAGEITARMRETLDIETILRTASQEIQQALGLPEVVIQLGTPPASEPVRRS